MVLRLVSGFVVFYLLVGALVNSVALLVVFVLLCFAFIVWCYCFRCLHCVV